MVHSKREQKEGSEKLRISKMMSPKMMSRPVFPEGRALIESVDDVATGRLEMIRLKEGFA
jgi:hypothetical protein